MKSMEMSAEEAKEYTEPTPGDAPKYPYGLSIDLNDDSLEKLGLTTLPEVGTVMKVVALAKVTRVSSNQRESGDNEASVGLQITDMEVSKQGNDLASRMYPSMS